MSAGICCIHFFINRSSHPEVFFKKDVLRIKTVYRGTSVQKCDSRQCSSVNMLHYCSRTPFLENTSGKLLLRITLDIAVINVEVLSKQVKDYLKYISIS